MFYVKQSFKFLNTLHGPYNYLIDALKKCEQLQTNDTKNSNNFTILDNLNTRIIMSI